MKRITAIWTVNGISPNFGVYVQNLKIFGSFKKSRFLKKKMTSFKEMNPILQRPDFRWPHISHTKEEQIPHYACKLSPLAEQTPILQICPQYLVAWKFRKFEGKNFLKIDTWTKFFHFHGKFLRFQKLLRQELF